MAGLQAKEGAEDDRDVGLDDNEAFDRDGAVEDQAKRPWDSDEEEETSTSLRKTALKEDTEQQRKRIKELEKELARLKLLGVGAESKKKMTEPGGTEGRRVRESMDAINRQTSAAMVRVSIGVPKHVADLLPKFEETEVTWAAVRKLTEAYANYLDEIRKQPDAAQLTPATLVECITVNKRAIFLPTLSSLTVVYTTDGAGPFSKRQCDEAVRKRYQLTSSKLPRLASELEDGHIWLLTDYLEQDVRGADDQRDFRNKIGTFLDSALKEYPYSSCKDGRKTIRIAAIQTHFLETLREKFNITELETVDYILMGTSSDPTVEEASSFDLFHQTASDMARLYKTRVKSLFPTSAAYEVYMETMSAVEEPQRSEIREQGKRKYFAKAFLLAEMCARVEDERMVQSIAKGLQDPSSHKGSNPRDDKSSSKVSKNGTKPASASAKQPAQVRAVKQTTTGSTDPPEKCIHCGETTHWSRNCKAPNALDVDKASLEELRKAFKNVQKDRMDSQEYREKLRTQQGSKKPEHQPKSKDKTGKTT